MSAPNLSAGYTVDIAQVTFLISTNQSLELKANVCTNFTESELTLKVTGQNVFAFSKQIYKKEKIKMNGNRENGVTQGKVCQN